MGLTKLTAEELIMIAGIILILFILYNIYFHFIEPLLLHVKNAKSIEFTDQKRVPISHISPELVELLRNDREVVSLIINSSGIYVSMKHSKLVDQAPKLEI